MQTTSAWSVPTPASNLWQRQSKRRHECFYRDVSVKNGDVASVARSLPEGVRERLRVTDIRSIDPIALAQLAGMLHSEGYLSHDASMELSCFQVDFKGPFDPLAETRDALKSLREHDASRYPLCVELYETAIDAMEGLQALIECLNGRIVDAYA